MIAGTHRDARFEINPRDHPRDKAYAGCFVSWALLLFGFSIACIVWQFWAGAIFGGVLLLAVVPYVLSQRNRYDVLQIDSEFLVVSKSHSRGTGIKLHRRNPLTITIEHVEDGASDAGIESTSTLNLWDVECGFRRRTILGLFLSEEAKGRVAEDLVNFLRSHGFLVDYRNEVSERRQTKRMEIDD